MFRLHDEEHRARGNRYEDRFNRQVPAAPGWTDVELSLDEIASAPKGRLLDLGRVASLGVFAVRLPAPRTIYLDAVRLVK